MKVLKIEITGKPDLYVPCYDLATVLMWLVEFFRDSDKVEFLVRSVEL